MHTLVIVSHPNIDRSNTQSFFRDAVSGLADVRWIHLDAATSTDQWPKQEDLQWANRIIFQFPLYWYSAPASLWAWLDELWIKGVVYDENGGLLTGKTLGLVVNSGQAAATFRMGGSNGRPLDDFLTPFAAIAKRTGMTMLPTLTVPQFDRMNEDARLLLLINYEQYLTLADPDDRSQQSDWFAAQLQAHGDGLLASTVQDVEAELDNLQQTVAELRQGEAD
ncbi:NAD(P)H-dependent oxidoreductase [Lacticaseibacillus pabuli]|uniref:NAD(P)H-dependent oxidoreductase n=1 Tax=Lacticaseibacillus pabuli TaxID=3025672 RepID=A0ABY7WU83_9LACO|nr:NAD(P)H-dependent oxidoreductase [Lacticaseibacillus sp. KACC 23028]WDF83018.1 NAD(P)H-dependent oxidoreductase [Lacticaseibacillus sp. KACC 23028]